MSKRAFNLSRAVGLRDPLKLFFVACWLLTPSLCEAGAPSFDVDIKPLFQSKCLHCHGEKVQKNGLDLRTRAGLIQGGKTGSAMQPGSLRESLIWTFVATAKMPADDGELTSGEKDLLRRWILAGAPQTASEAAKVTAKTNQEATVVADVRGVEVMAGRIDEQISVRLKEEDVSAAPKASDAEFLRRVYLDLNGRTPSFDETLKFLESNHPQKRAELIEQRLASPEFGGHMAIIWHKLLIPKSAGAYSRIPHDKFRNWLSGEFNEDRPWSEIVSSLVTAEGYLPSNKDNANNRKKDAKLQPQNVATAFINAHNTEGRPQPKGIVASVSRLFLAQSIECAQCHNHPQAKWEQTDFWAAAAFFERVRYERAVYGDTSIGKLVEPIEGNDLIYEDKAKARYSFVKGVYDEAVIDMEDPNGQLTGQMIRAKFLDGPQPELDPQKSYRASFAGWATSKTNPYFARAMVNRVWAQLLGRGFVEPVDDMSEDNPPSHPQLLADLSAEFAATGFDVKHLIRCICNSQTYQRTSAPPGGKPASQKLFAHQSLKQMTEYQLLASLRTVAPTFAAMLEEDARDKNPGLERKAFLEVHETDPSSATEHTRGLQQALRMMNGDGQLFNREALSAAVSSKATIEQNITSIYLLALNRRPEPAELMSMKQYVESATEEISKLDKRRLPQRRKDRPDNTPDAYADILWVLLNSGEFIFNH